MGRDTVAGFGARVKQLREAAGLTQTALAEKAGTHFTTVAKLEADERSASLRLAVSLAEALGVSVADLVPGHAARRGQSVKKGKGK